MAHAFAAEHVKGSEGLARAKLIWCHDEWCLESIFLHFLWGFSRSRRHEVAREYSGESGSKNLVARAYADMTIISSSSSAFMNKYLFIMTTLYFIS